MEHSGTHIDAISHQADMQVLANGMDGNRISRWNGYSSGGVEEIEPIVRRGVLLDIARHRGMDRSPAGEAISLAEVQACCSRQATEIQPGDVVLVRTGLGAIWNSPAEYLAGPGLHGDVSRWLATLDVHAVGADNMAWDVIGLWDDVEGCQLPGHLVLLARRGIYIIENLMLEAIAAASHHAFTFVCTPLKFTGATGSPVRPIAVIRTVVRE